MTNKKIVVILGETASGKSALGIKIAQEYNGEILCADSRTIYKGMDIGTAKPTAEDQKSVVHHGLDLINPSQSYSAAEFKEYAEQTVNDIVNRGKLPVIVGGSGLYIDAFVYDFSFTSKADNTLRAQIDSKNLLQLQQQAIELGITEDDPSFKNKRHLGRLIERVLSGEVGSTRVVKPANVLLIGLRVPREQLVARIENRVNTMFDNGLIDEAEQLRAEHGPEAPGLLAPAYKAAAEYFDGNATFEESKNIMIRGDKRLAKRQRTWFGRNPDIHWCDTEQEAIKNIRAFLQ